jgi:hypothetical protein
VFRRLDLDPIVKSQSLRGVEVVLFIVASLPVGIFLLDARDRSSLAANDALGPSMHLINNILGLEGQLRSSLEPEAEGVLVPALSRHTKLVAEVSSRAWRVDSSRLVVVSHRQDARWHRQVAEGSTSVGVPILELFQGTSTSKRSLDPRLDCLHSLGSPSLLHKVRDVVLERIDHGSLAERSGAGQHDIDDLRPEGLDDG